MESMLLHSKSTKSSKRLEVHEKIVRILMHNNDNSNGSNDDRLPHHRHLQSLPPPLPKPQHDDEDNGDNNGDGDDNNDDDDERLEMHLHLKPQVCFVFSLLFFFITLLIITYRSTTMTLPPSSLPLSTTIILTHQ